MSDNNQQQSGPYPFLGAVKIHPQPQPTQVLLQPIRTEDGRRMVALQIATLSGVQTYFWTPEEAAQLGTALQRLAGTGIEIVPNGSPLARRLKT